MRHHPLLVSLAVLLTTATVLIVYDVWLFRQGGAEATISYQFHAECCDNPIVAGIVMLLLGILIGHLLWPLK